MYIHMTLTCHERQLQLCAWQHQGLAAVWYQTHNGNNLEGYHVSCQQEMHTVVARHTARDN